MSRRFVLCMTVLTGDLLTVKAVDSEGEGVEERLILQDGEPYHVAGNFEDEADLSEELFEALQGLKEAGVKAMAVLEKEKEKEDSERVQWGPLR